MLNLYKPMGKSPLDTLGATDWVKAKHSGDGGSAPEAVS